jgi:hypothetical protein
MLHATLPKHEYLDDEALETPAGRFDCKHQKGSSAAESGDSSTEFRTETWLSERSPFGVVKFWHKKQRSRGGQSQGGRSMTMTLAEVGTNAKSSISQ